MGARALVGALLLVTATAFAADADDEAQPIHNHKAPSWAKQLQHTLQQIDDRHQGELGVYIEDLSSGLAVSLRADDYWYLASGIKVPVAIAILRMVDQGELDLNTPLNLLASDYVDGAGPTNWREPNSKLRVSYLLKQMLTVSDNTASDILIRTAGIDNINNIQRELVPEGLGAATSLADVRRHTYSAFHEDAFNLTGRDFLALRNQHEEQERLAMLAKLLGVEKSELSGGDLDSAYGAYYESKLNAGTLRAYAALLKSITTGEALSQQSTQYLLNLLTQVKTGSNRIKAALPHGVAFAHKTGTQHRRACDLGIAISAAEADARASALRHAPVPPATIEAGDTTTLGNQPPPGVIINACVAGFNTLADAERALRAVGQAAVAAGVLKHLNQSNTGESPGEQG